MMPDEPSQAAIGLYTIGARDADDFLDYSRRQP